MRPHDLAVEPAGRSQGMPAVVASVVTTGPSYRLQLRLERAELEVEAEMTKSRFVALGLAEGAAVMLQPREFGLFPSAEAAPAAPLQLPQRLDADRPRAAVA